MSLVYIIHGESLSIVGWSLNANFAKIRGFYFSEFVAIFPNFFGKSHKFWRYLVIFSEYWSFFRIFDDFSEDFGQIFRKIWKNRNFSELFGKIKTANFGEIGI